MCLSQITSDYTVDCFLHLTFMNRAEQNASSMWWGQTIAVVQWPVIHFHSPYMFLWWSWWKDSRFLRPCQDIPASWASTSHSGDTSCSDCGDLVEASPGCHLVQALLPHQIPLAQTWDQGMGRELGSAAGCQHLNASCSYVLPVSSFLLLFGLSFQNIFLLFIIGAEQACMTVWHQLFHGERVRGKEEKFPAIQAFRACLYTQSRVFSWAPVLSLGNKAESDVQKGMGKGCTLQCWFCGGSSCSNGLVGFHIPWRNNPEAGSPACDSELKKLEPCIQLIWVQQTFFVSSPAGQALASVGAR